MRTLKIKKIGQSAAEPRIEEGSTTILEMGMKITNRSRAKSFGG